MAGEIDNFLKMNNIRVEIDARNEKIGFKIREAEVEKTPFMIIVGDKEVESGHPSVRRKGKGDLGAMSREQLLEIMQEEIDKKEIVN